MNPFDFFSMSDNLYYLDQIGSVDDQIAFLRSLSIQDAQHVVSRREGEYVLFVVRSFHVDKFYSFLIKVCPGIVVKSFINRRVVNLPVWLLNNGFCTDSKVVNFKSRKLCLEEEEDTDVVTTADAVDQSLSEG